MSYSLSELSTIERTDTLCLLCPTTNRNAVVLQWGNVAFSLQRSILLILLFCLGYLSSAENTIHIESCDISNSPLTFRHNLKIL